MPYKFEQTIKGKTYVYEITSYWDKKKKQPRQIRKYIGKKHPDTGKIIPPHRNIKNIRIKTCKDFGNIYFLNSIANKIHLIDTIKKVFPHLWKEIITTVFFEISEKKPMYLCNNFIDSAAIEYVKQLSSQRISELFKQLGESIQQRIIFFKEWIKKRNDFNFLVFDITSLSSYSKLNEYVEWGYNRDNEKLPQINLGLIFGEPSGLPIFYKTYEGSICDVTTLDNIFKYIEYLKVRNILFILDKGFYSRYNLMKMNEKKKKFLISVPFSVKITKELIEKNKKKINDIEKAFQINKQILYGVKNKVIIDGTDFWAYIYYDEIRMITAKTELIKRVLEIEKKVKQINFREEKKIREYMKETLKGWDKIFKIERGKLGFSLRRREEKIKQIIEKMGYTVLLSNIEFTSQDAIELYRKKDGIEKLFNVIKNELGERRLWVDSYEGMEGRLFITFMSLIIYSWIKKVMKEKNLYTKYTVEEVIYELKKIKRIEIGEGQILYTELTKRQKDLFEAFGIEKPFST